MYRPHFCTYLKRFTICPLNFFEIGDYQQTHCIRVCSSVSQLVTLLLFSLLGVACGFVYIVSTLWYNAIVIMFLFKYWSTMPVPSKAKQYPQIICCTLFHDLANCWSVSFFFLFISQYLLLLLDKPQWKNLASNLAPLLKNLDTIWIQNDPDLAPQDVPTLASLVVLKLTLGLGPAEASRARSLGHTWVGQFEEKGNFNKL